MKLKLKTFNLVEFNQDKPAEIKSTKDKQTKKEAAKKPIIKTLNCGLLQFVAV